ncbi:MAG: hypothetical protein C4527_18525 [Candidatus Omnitrophota bacterium]|jgi:ABC-type Fe3+-siderophore transport system permease subunit|nr:MAG: hypothetical protein C4527_18525 [Candidatus Omnitrophota bacterium]
MVLTDYEMILSSILIGIGLFLVGLLRDVFRRDDERGFRGNAISALICVIGISILRLALPYLPIPSFLGAIAFYGIVWLSFQLDDIYELILFFAGYRITSFAVQLLFVKLLS